MFPVCFRAKDPHLPKYPTIIKVFNEHNHTLHTADILKFKDVSLETKNKFLKLFESGHSPYSALEFHRMDLQNNYGDEYYLKAADRSICPDLNWCYKYDVEKLSEYTISYFNILICFHFLIT